MTITKLSVAALMTSTLLAAPALAQSTTEPARPNPPMASPASAPTVQQSGQWRGSKLVGLDVYNAANEKIGDITELVTDKNGKIAIVVIGVGGFLGMGQHDVGLAWEQVRFESQPRTGSTSTTGASTAASANIPRDYPDHAVVNMTKDQLKGLPAFKYASDTKSR